MELNDFIKNFAYQFDDTDESEIMADTHFRELDEWCSMIGLSVLNMIDKKCGVKLTFDEMKGANTVEELYKLVLSKSA